MTPQRRIVLDALMAEDGHATALDLYERVVDTFPSLNRATVYRTLDFFCTEGVVTRSELNGRLLYEIAGEEPHHHLHCAQCGQMVELDNHHFTDLVAHLANEHDFQADLNHLVITGICGDCSRTT